MNDKNERNELLQQLLSKTITKQEYNEKLDKLMERNNVSCLNNIDCFF